MFTITLYPLEMPTLGISVMFVDIGINDYLFIPLLLESMAEREIILYFVWYCVQFPIKLEERKREKERERERV